MRLSKGDKVTITEPLSIYGCGYRDESGDSVYPKVPAGSVGVVGEPRVPSVRRTGVYFACVDFSASLAGHAYGPELMRQLPRLVRVAALPEQLA